MWVPNRNRIIEQLKSYSVRTGEEFILASGQTSNVYIDVKKTSMRAYSQPFIVNALVIAAMSLGTFDAAAGVVLGGCHLASLVAAANETDTIYVRTHPKTHGTKNLIEAPDSLKGRNVVVFEDVITTGRSALNAARALIEHNFNVKGIVALVDRRPNKSPNLGTLPFVSVIDFEELI